jgi:hypothetical protein
MSEEKGKTPGLCNSRNRLERHCSGSNGLSHVQQVRVEVDSVS